MLRRRIHFNRLHGGRPSRRKAAKVQWVPTLTLIGLALVWSSMIFKAGGIGAAEAAYAVTGGVSSMPSSPWQSIKLAVGGARHHLIAAAVARCVSISALYPLDTIKTRMQMEGVDLGLRKGISNLYAGIGGSLFGQIPYGMLTFGTYEMYKTAMLNCSNLDRVPQTLVFCVAAILGDLTGSLWLVPSELIKLQMQGGMHSSAAGAAVSIVRKSGFGGLYQGFTGQVVRDVPFRALQMTSYELLKSLHRKWTTSTPTTPAVGTTAESGFLRLRSGKILKPQRLETLPRKDAGVAGTVPRSSSRAAATSANLSGVDAAALGAVAGTIASVLTTPLDVMRTRQMTIAPGSRVGMLGVNWFAGVVPRATLIGPSCALFFVVYEGVRKRLDARVPLNSKPVAQRKGR